MVPVAMVASVFVQLDAESVVAGDDVARTRSGRRRRAADDRTAHRCTAQRAHAHADDEVRQCDEAGAVDADVVPEDRVGNRRVDDDAAVVAGDQVSIGGGGAVSPVAVRGSSRAALNEAAISSHSRHSENPSFSCATEGTDKIAREIVLNLGTK
jgi:hypothetical protein